MIRAFTRVFGRLKCRLGLHEWDELANVLSVESDEVEYCKRCHQWRWL
jgi:hypothetical protein